MKPERTRLDLLNEFYAAPIDTLFPQTTLCAVMDHSKAQAERNRWAGAGVPFIKIGRSVRYRKYDILAYLEKYRVQESTTDIQDKENHHVS
jgi:hypothetical protein